MKLSDSRLLELFGVQAADGCALVAAGPLSRSPFPVHCSYHLPLGCHWTFSDRLVLLLLPGWNLHRGICIFGSVSKVCIWVGRLAFVAFSPVTADISGPRDRLAEYRRSC